MLKVIDTFLFYSKQSYGEDRIFCSSDFYCVIDGATPIEGQHFYGFSSQAEWFVESIRQYFEKEHSALDFPKICSDFIKEIKQDGILDSITEEYNLPAATIAAITQKDGMLNGFSLGDCGIIVQKTDKSILRLLDTRVSTFANLTIKAKQKAMADNTDYRPFVKAQMKENRKKMNTEGSYWTIAPKGDFSKEFLEFHMPANEVERCILYTDGLQQICDMCNIAISDLLTLEKPSDKIKKCIHEAVARTIEPSSHIKTIDDIGFIVIARR